MNEQERIDAYRLAQANVAAAAEHLYEAWISINKVANELLDANTENTWLDSRMMNTDQQPLMSQVASMAATMRMDLDHA